MFLHIYIFSAYYEPYITILVLNLNFIYNRKVMIGLTSSECTVYKKQIHIPIHGLEVATSWIYHVLFRHNKVFYFNRACTLWYFWNLHELQPLDVYTCLSLGLNKCNEQLRNSFWYIFMIKIHVHLINRTLYLHEPCEELGHTHAARLSGLTKFMTL